MINLNDSIKISFNSTTCLSNYSKNWSVSVCKLELLKLAFANQAYDEAVHSLLLLECTGYMIV